MSVQRSNTSETLHRQHFCGKQACDKQNVAGTLEHLALIRGAVAVHCDGHGAVRAVLVREPDARAHRHLRADDAVAAEEAGRVHVHRAALSPAAARLAPCTSHKRQSEQVR